MDAQTTAALSRLQAAQQAVALFTGEGAAAQAPAAAAPAAAAPAAAADAIDEESADASAVDLLLLGAMATTVQAARGLINKSSEIATGGGADEQRQEQCEATAERLLGHVQGSGRKKLGGKKKRKRGDEDEALPAPSGAVGNRSLGMMIYSAENGGLKSVLGRDLEQQRGAGWAEDASSEAIVSHGTKECYEGIPLETFDRFGTGVLHVAPGVAEATEFASKQSPSRESTRKFHSASTQLVTETKLVAGKTLVVKDLAVPKAKVDLEKLYLLVDGDLMEERDVHVRLARSVRQWCFLELLLSISLTQKVSLFQDFQDILGSRLVEQEDVGRYELVTESMVGTHYVCTKHGKFSAKRPRRGHAASSMSSVVGSLEFKVTVQPGDVEGQKSQDAQTVPRESPSIQAFTLTHLQAFTLTRLFVCCRRAHDL